MWRPDLTPTVIKGKAAFRWPRQGEIIITTYGSLPDSDQLPAPAGCYLIADEAHNLKNPKTTRAKRWQMLRGNVVGNGGKVWLLTGTPLLNRPPELWAVLGAAGLQEAAFGSWPKFVSLFDGYRGRFGYEWGTGPVSPEAPLALQRVSLHRRRLDVLPDLPVKRHRTIEVNGLPASAVRACDEVVEMLRSRGIDLDSIGPDVDLGSLIAGPVFALMSKARAQLATAKLPHAIELIEEYEEAGEPVVLVSAHREPVDVVGSRPGWGAITGETSPEDRAKIAEQFQAGSLKGVALTFKAGGVGITLTRAAHMVMVDQDWTPALICQAEDRLCRIGATRGILITVIVATHPLDKRVNELLSEKRALIEGAIEASAVSASYQAEDPAQALHAAAEAAAAAVEATAKPEAPAPVRPPSGGYTPATLPTGGEAVGKFRYALGEIEHHAGRAILTLAGSDTDRAGLKNDLGFNKPDTDFGHSLADTLRRYGRLSDRQWAAAIRLVVKYHNQVGRPGGSQT
jgi:SWI/SNF-related matrix-associated actin-dependent regulator 1 of chromatin subfamily A